MAKPWLAWWVARDRSRPELACRSLAECVLGGTLALTGASLELPTAVAGSDRPLASWTLLNGASPVVDGVTADTALWAQRRREFGSVHRGEVRHPAAQLSICSANLPARTGGDL
jgi:hypothetical protein